MFDDDSTPAQPYRRSGAPATMRWLLVDESGSGAADVAVAACVDVEGLFVDDPAAAPAATLLGCRPGPPLRLALDALTRGAGNPGGALHRRRIDAALHSLADSGMATRVIGASLGASVTAVRPSVLGHDLLDVAFDAAIGDPLPGGARDVWELWRAGRPAAPGLWTGYDRGLRHEWSRAALAHHPDERPDRPAGGTFHLDGSVITDVEGFYCAIGEAVNGPGGYFGWNPAALSDCVLGGWGATSPFRLVWHHAEVARTNLTGESGTAATFPQLLGWLRADGVQVEWR
ncbi:barstar family protein [Micromonospora sp. NPDC000089]|uniref:barstar family protein n=1 Tax=unclassified Micromonospora TaxID=2617518 RepID=UPI003686CB84